MVEVLRKPDIVSIFETLMRYLFAADSKINYEMVRTTIERSEATEGIERVMSIAEELIQKGRQEAAKRVVRRVPSSAGFRPFRSY